MTRITLLLLGAATLAAPGTAHAQARSETRFHALGDLVIQRNEPGVPGMVMLGLETGHPWYRAIKLFDNNGVQMEVQRANGQYQTTEALVLSPLRLPGAFTIEFWKAKLLGVPAKVYEKTFNTTEFTGRRITFEWLEGPDGDGPVNVLPATETTLTSSDGDRVKARNEPGQAGRVQIRFGTASQVTWWKAVRVFDNRGQAIDIERQDRRQLTPDINLPRDRFDRTIRIEFWKAKFLGVRTRVMGRQYRADDLNGRILTFTWLQD